MDDFCPSSLIWGEARRWFEAAQKTRDDDPLGHANTPTYYLAGHALELTLKAFLRAKGMSIEELKDDIRHDLGKALEVAEAKGLSNYVTLSETDRAVISLLNEYYRAKELEYAVAGLVRLPNFNVLNTLVENILNKTERICLDGMELHFGKPTAFIPPWAKKLKDKGSL